MGEKNHVYIIGICGVTTAPLAKMFLDLGWNVDGSDQGSYPPMSEYLKKIRISFKTPYSEDNLTYKPDLVVIGGNALVANPQNPEYLKAKKFGCEVVSYPQVLEKYIIKENSLVIAGTYGKTTITALTAWLLKKAGYNPSFMIGGLALNFPDGVKRTDSTYSVVEGDEHPTLNFSLEPKFMHYRPKYALITAALWEHLNVFRTEEIFVKAFIDFVKLIPKTGILVTCLDGENVKKVIEQARCKVVTYALRRKADFVATNIVYGSDYVQFKVNNLPLKSPLIGEHNVQNVLGAAALAMQVGLSPETIQEAIESFKGVKRRLEIRGNVKGVTVVDDLAHSAVKIRETLRALRTKYKSRRIFAIFDPHASSFRDRKSLAWYEGVFSAADEVLVAKVPPFKAISPEERVLGSEIVEAIKKTQPKVHYFPKDDKLIEYIIDQVTSGDIIVFLSSGGFRGIIEKTLKALSLKKD